jgi:hypothetical protein
MISNFFSSLMISFMFLTNTSTPETSVGSCTDLPIIEGVQEKYYFEIGDDELIFQEKIIKDIKAKSACDSSSIVPVLNFTNVADYTIENEYIISFQAMDKDGNEKTVKATLYVVYDITDPIIDKTKDLTVEIHSTPSYRDGIVVTDNKDEEPSLSFDDTNVDLTQLGVYDLIYIAKDKSGNESRITVKVTVVDTIKPEVTGNKDLSFEVDTNVTMEMLYKDIDIKDNSKAVVERQIIGFEAINTGRLGTYTIKYKFTDVGGNFVEFEHKVKIVDTTKPTIKLKNPIRYKLNQGSISYKDFLEISDNYDDLAYNDVLIYDQNVHFDQPGYYKVHFFVSDSSGNHTSLSADIAVFDEDMPIFSGLPETIEVPLNSNSIDYFSGVTVIDATDGDITDRVVVYDDLVNMNKLGNYTVYYMLFDSSNNQVMKEVTVHVYDNKKPEIIGLQDLTIEVKTKTEYDFLSGIEATDDYDTNLQITITENDVNFEVLGIYTVTYQVIDSSNNETIESIKVNIVDTTKPTLINVKDMILKLGETVDLKKDLRAVDLYDGDLTDQINLSGDEVNFNVIGEYEVKVEVTDTSGNIAFEYFKVNITENPQKVEEDKGTNPFAQLDEKIVYVLGAMVAVIVVGVSVQVIRRKPFKKR